MTSTARAAIILAAGQGTRMKSPLPKVLHPVGGRAMLDHAIDAAEALGCERVVVVVGAHSPEVRAHVARRLGEDCIAVQDPPLGTGHAVRAAESALGDFVGQVVVTYGDVPLLTAADIEPVFGSPDGVTVIGFEAADPGAYGRLVMDGEDLLAITEAKEASPEVLALTACNSGVMAAPAGLLFELLAEVRNDNAKGEYYLTDVVELARRRGAPTRAVFAAEDAVMGVNSQAELAQAESLFQQRRRAAFLADGVTMPAPDTVHFAFDTEVGGGTVIEPYVVFGPGAKIASGARIRAFSHVEGATVAAGATANHLAYLGDGEVGPKANIGAGTIICNYDGFFKHRTPVGEGAFVGSNSSLVAPVSIGANAMVGSGSVVTKDVAPGDLALARGQQTTKPGWAARFMETMRAKKAART